MSTPEDAIRARRRLTNKFIAAHDAQRLRPFFAADAKLIAGEGSLIIGADEIVAAFAGQFADPDFVTYVRTPERIESDAAGARAAEHGRWAASWKSGEMSGSYLAVWRKVTGQWVIESETFVTLQG
ncbi:YybH family protein [Phenylobacterium deserti]|uniref:Nuclear transport factor 2 family protein n=1 Tax=Phenylobacterium deserti TaxID=1914756 RepID=A0A328AC10_9CAUL|nr:nuclear transport factor 2 family protein [Phenylobacterium deserti]RAK50894.1 nuclear transport factor 2 family protein [Phenylobacterium deserti]